MKDGLPRFQAPVTGALSTKMLTAYADAGFIVLEGFVAAESCVALKERVAEMVAGLDPSARHSVFSTTDQPQLADEYFLGSGDAIRFFFESQAFDENGALRQAKEDGLNKIGHALHDLDPVFDRFSRSRKLAAAVSSLGIERPAIIQSMYIFKPAGIGGEVALHQDSTYLYTEPESCVGFWFALDDATRDNGCMYFIPGAHRGPLRARHVRKAGGGLETRPVDTTPWPDVPPVAAEAGRGTLVIFNGRAPHSSGPNRSARARHAYTLHVIDRACHYPADNWLQRTSNLPLRGFDER